MAMQYVTLTEQPYTQATATAFPRTERQKIAEYDAVEVGSYLHWFDGGWAWHEGTVQWAGEWAEMPSRTGGRERLVVVAVPERVNERGDDCDGGLMLLRIQRWGDQYAVSVVTSTGIRYRRPVEEFIATVLRRRNTEQAFGRAIASQLNEENDW